MSTQACRRARSTAIARIATSATVPLVPAFSSQARRAASSDVASLATELAGLAAAGMGESPRESEGPRRKYDAMIARGELQQDSRQALTVDQLERVYQDLVASRQSRSGSGLTLVDASSSTKQTRRRTGWWGSIVDSLGDHPAPSSAPSAPRGLYMYGGPGCGMCPCRARRAGELDGGTAGPPGKSRALTLSPSHSFAYSLAHSRTQALTHARTQGKQCSWTCLPHRFPATWPRGWSGCTTTTLCWTCTSPSRNIAPRLTLSRRLPRISPQSRASSAWTSSSSMTLPTPQSCIVCSTISGAATSP